MSSFVRTLVKNEFKRLGYTRGPARDNGKKLGFILDQNGDSTGSTRYPTYRARRAS
jgi:hypothetical protein